MLHPKGTTLNKYEMEMHETNVRSAVTNNRSWDNVNPIKPTRAALNLHPSISYFQLLILIRMKYMVPGAVAEGRWWRGPADVGEWSTYRKDCDYASAGFLIMIHVDLVI